MVKNTTNHSLFPVGISGYFLLIVCIALLIVPVCAGSTTVSIPTDGDTYITERSPNASDDGVDGMFVQTMATKNDNYRGVVHFNLSSIPLGATVTDAALHLYLLAYNGGDGVTEYYNDVHRITGGDFSAPVLKWATCPAFESIPTDSQSVGTANGVWVVWNVTPDMQAYASGDPMFGWVIKYPVESLSIPHVVFYNTLECTDPAYRPYLEVTYTEGGAAAPTAAFTADVTSGTAPLTVQFTDASTGDGITDWAWDFENDGTVDSTDQSPSHVFDTTGTYTVNLTVTNAGGSDSEVKTDYITVSEAPALLWGPYLTGTTTTGTVVNVKTNIATAVSVEYATDAYYTAHSAYDQSATDGVSTQLHHVSLASLTPDTMYHYRVIYDGQTTGDLHFRTFPESGAFTFVVYSDTQDQLPTFSQLERHKLVADRIAEEPDVAFVLNSGDLVNDASNLSDWDRYFAAGKNLMARIPVFPALGNHDDYDPYYSAIYGIPEYYSFDCADIHVAVLNSNDWAWPDLPTQSAWLAADLETAKPFKFVSFHHPLYTSEAKHFGGWENLRLEWEDDFNENGVLAVFNGHVHAYERLVVNDTNYFVVGIGGGPSYNLATPRYEASVSSLEYALGYIRVTIDPVARTATAEMIRVADVSSDLKNITTLYPPNTISETVIMSLSSPPIALQADFTSDIQSGSAPLTVQFTDASIGDGITSWAWDFENDGTVDSTDQSPSHVFDTAGTYTVNLTVMNAGGNDSEVKTDYITVTTSSQGDREVYLTPVSLPVMNGTTAEFEVRISSLPEGLAGYDLRVTIDNPSIAEIVGVQYPGWAAFNNTTPQPPAHSLRLSGVDSGRLVEAGAGSTLLATITVRADATGTSRISITNVNMDADGGVVITPAAVTPGEIVVYIPMIADFEANVTGGKASLSRPFFVAFTDLSTGVPPGSLWSWDFDNNGVVDSILQNPVTSYVNPGNYTVSLTVQNAYSSDTETKYDYIRITRFVKPFPGMTDEPTDPDGDSHYEDINGNGRLDYDDIVIYYENMQWIRDQADVDIEAFDYNQNGRIDYDDVVVLYQELLAGH
ncbi:MAG: PKD domain protein [Methanoregulaceae archaeon PtaU1.Bin059]|nr:MAG: PKD domain protein [Methanoregulaceae archaeon PtaB.Bin152]OPY36824.1 MAG: PKD domain protein [Methanoregulaceae archaeon PtaU1.Bin059]